MIFSDLPSLAEAGFAKAGTLDQQGEDLGALFQ
jgi:hypothetical protein